MIRPDGTVVPVDVETQSRVMIDRSQMGSNIYNPNNKIYRVSIPELEIGDMVRYVSYRDEMKTRMPRIRREVGRKRKRALFPLPIRVNPLKIRVIRVEKHLH